MKKFTFFSLMFLMFSGLSIAQVIEDFEIPGLVLQSANPSTDKSSFSFVPNPDPTGINTSSTVLKYVRDIDNKNWSAFIGRVIPFKLENAYVHMKIWSPKISGGVFAFVAFGDGPEYGADPMHPQTIVNGWEELVFSYQSTTIYAEYFEYFHFPAGLTEDITMYIDDITINHDSVVGSKPELILMDFEPISLNLMLGGDEDKSAMTISPNPDPDLLGVNISSNVIKYRRDKDGVPWGGFWSTLPAPIDVTTNKFMHVKVWKPRISPVKFKIEGGAAGNLEIESKYPQTKINEWEDMVFDFSNKTGVYPTIAFMPDFADPITITEDITIYFDDIVLNNDPLPRAASEVVFNVDMTDAGLTAAQKVYISEIYAGNAESYVLPGTLRRNEMTDPDGDGIYTVKMNLPDGPFTFRFYMGEGTAFGDYGPWDRTYTVQGSANLTYKWQLGGLVVPPDSLKKQVFNVDMTGARLSVGQKIYISGSFGGIHGTWVEPGTNPQNEMTDYDGDGKYSITLHLPDGTYNFKFFKGAGWNGGEWPGDPNRSYTVNGSKTMDFTWGVSGTRGQLNEYNLITDGHFDFDGPIVPSLKFLSAWVGTSYNSSGNLAEVTNGVLSISNTVTSANALDFWVAQTLNKYGKILHNDSTYILIFDAWAIKERVLSIKLGNNGKNSVAPLGFSLDYDAINGESAWNVNLSTNKTTYIRKVKMKVNPTTSSFHFFLMVNTNIGTVYIDNIYLISMNDFRNYGVQVAGITVTSEGGATSIATDKGTLQMNAQVLPESAWIKNVAWSVINGTGNAAIDEAGLLTAITDGKITVVATSTDGSATSDSLEITISNQNEKPGLPIDFENISDLAWNIYNNGTYSYGQFSITPNPSLSSINHSEHVLRFIVNKDAGTYAGASSTAFGPYSFTCNNNIVNLSIKKSVKTTVGLKLEQSTSGGPDTLITVAANAINQWQKLKFDFSAVAGHTYQKITIYPDIRTTRTTQTVVYIDDIAFPCVTGVSDNKTSIVKIYPNPVKDILNVVLNSPNTKLTIYNSLGSKISEYFSYENIAEIVVSHYSPGIYILKTDDGSVAKFVK